jgi:integrase
MEDKKQRVKLTKRLVDSIISPENGQVFLRDISLVGFAVRVTHGSKSFVLERRIHGRPRRITLGHYPPMTIEQARSKAETLIGEIANGRDPAQERIDKQGEITFGNLEEMYRKRHLPRKRSAHADEWMLKTYLSNWKNRRLSSIYRKDVISLHEQIGRDHSQYTANRVVTMIRKMFNCARDWGLFTDKDNPATRIEFFPEKKRDRFVHPNELPKLFESLQQEPNIYIRAIILVSLLTGQRKGEVLNMKHEDIDLTQGIWRIPMTKPGKPHILPIPAPVVELLRNLPAVAGNPFVFPGKGSSHLASLQRPWELIRTRAGLPDLWLHDLRRSTGSWLAGAGASLPLIGKVLGHTSPAVTQVYARFDLEPVRIALESNAQRMLAAGTGPGGESGK